MPDPSRAPDEVEGAALADPAGAAPPDQSAQNIASAAEGAGGAGVEGPKDVSSAIMAVLVPAKTPDPTGAASETPAVGDPAPAPAPAPGPAPASASADDPAQVQDPASGTGADPAADDDDAALLAGVERPRVKQRIQTLLNERRALRQQLDDARPAVDAWSERQRFLVERQITTEQTQYLDTVADALSRRDYGRFLALVTPYVEQAQMALGQRLPEDLQSQVSEGLITQEAAAELTRARLETQAARAEAERLRVDRTQHQQQTAEAHVAAVVSDVTQWMNAQAGRDPDFAQKRRALGSMVQAELTAWEAQHRRLPDSATAIRIANECLTEINGLRASPPPPPTPPTPRNSAPPSHQPAPHLRTVGDAVLASLR